MEATVVYRFHIALRGVSPKIWRRVELTACSSLANLQRVIQVVMGWSDEYQHRFCIRNHYLGTSRPGGLLFFGDPEAMTLFEFAFRLQERFTYEYNFFDAWLFDARFEGGRASDSKRCHPRCVAGARRAPLADSGGAEMFMDRHVAEMPGARKARHVERRLREIAVLLKDPALDDRLQGALATDSRSATAARFRSPGGE